MLYKSEVRHHQRSRSTHKIKSLQVYHFHMSWWTTCGLWCRDAHCEETLRETSHAKGGDVNYPYVAHVALIYHCHYQLKETRSRCLNL